MNYGYSFCLNANKSLSVQCVFCCVGGEGEEVVLKGFTKNWCMDKSEKKSDKHVLQHH